MPKGPRAHLRQERRHCTNGQIHPAGYQIRNRLSDTVTGHERQIDVAILREHLGAKVIRRADEIAMLTETLSR